MQYPLIKIPYVFHDQQKEILLDAINKTPSSGHLEQNGETIENTDYFINSVNSDDNRYVEIIKPNMTTIVSEMMDYVGFTEWEISAWWFQQYVENDEHGWHWHRGTFYNCVYFVELPKGSPSTELEVPVTRERMSLNAQEGDIIMFPSHFRHRSPPNGSGRKTVIAFNIT